jgi:hypothetical protein
VFLDASEIFEPFSEHMSIAASAASFSVPSDSSDTRLVAIAIHLFLILSCFPVHFVARKLDDNQSFQSKMSVVGTFEAIR